MCGITAIYDGAGGVSAEALAAATTALAHRGPDGSDIWIEDGHRLGLGHTRLSIAAPHDVQPLSNEAGTLFLVANGEFYDYRRLRRDLQARGHRFTSEGDSEIVLHLYEEGGMECLSHLRGEFAFLLWDRPRATLFAVRDRFGIKPLFYAPLGDKLLFGSEVKALLAGGLPAAWDTEAVFQQLFGCFHNDRSLFAGVRQVPPGHYLAVKGREERLVHYWDVPYSGRQIAPGRENARDGVRRRLEEAVRLRMDAHVPVGCLLSGGLDSSSVLALAARHSRQPVAAFTVAFDRERYDESERAQIMARHVGAVLHLVEASDARLARHLPAAAWHGEMVQYNAHGTARFLLSRHIQAQGYRAVLAGEGADELFAGYGFVRAAVLAAGGRSRWAQFGRVARLFGAPSAPERQIAETSPLLARASRLLTLPPALVTGFAHALGLLRSLLAPAFLQAQARRDPYRAFLGTFPWHRLWRVSSAKQLLYLWLRSLFANYHMAADRLDMAHAVEVRLPFLDHALFEYGARLPVDYQAEDGQQKHLLREAARPLLPEAVLSSAKQPFFAPPLIARPGSQVRALARDTFHDRALGCLPFFEPAAARALLARAPQATPDEQALLEPLLMMILSFALLQEQFAMAG